MAKNSYFKKSGNQDEFVMSDFDRDYKFKGFAPEQFRKNSNRFTEFRGSQVSTDGENVVVLVGADHVFPTKYGYGVIVDASHVVWVKSWQVWGLNRAKNAYAINFSKAFYSVKEYGDFSDNFSDNLEKSALSSFEKVVELANEQAELRSTLEGRERATELGYGFVF